MVLPGLEEVAETNMKEMFLDNPHRGIAIGMDQERNVLQFTWIMGRSPNSQNRVYSVDDHRVFTEAADESKVEDPSLIIYNSMRSEKHFHIVSNGDQTDSFFYDDGRIKNGTEEDEGWLSYNLATRFCEPDAPIFTPRITAYFRDWGIDEEDDDQHAESYRPTASFASLTATPYAIELWLDTIEKHNLTLDQFRHEKVTEKEASDDFKVAVSMLSGLNPDEFPTEGSYWTRDLKPGFAHCLPTYKPGSKVLDAYDGSPFLINLEGDTPEDMMKGIWDSLDDGGNNWRVSLACKVIKPNGDVYIPEPINRYEKPEPAA